MACRTPWHFRAAGMSGLFSALPVNVQEARGYMRAIQQCSTDLYRTAVTSSYCVSYRRLAIKQFSITTYLHTQKNNTITTKDKSTLKECHCAIITSLSSSSTRLTSANTKWMNVSTSWRTKSPQSHYLGKTTNKLLYKYLYYHRVLTILTTVTITKGGDSQQWPVHNNNQVRGARRQSTSNSASAHYITDNSICDDHREGSTRNFRGSAHPVFFLLISMVIPYKRRYHDHINSKILRVQSTPLGLSVFIELDITNITNIFTQFHTRQISHTS